MSEFDATVVGSGPNGLAAAVELARSGRKTLVVEGAKTIGGGTRTEELTLPGFLHDVCSAIHPSGVASPFLKEIGLKVDWIHPPIPFTHPLDDGRVVALYQSVEETAAQMGDDASRYVGLMKPFVDNIDDLVEDVLSPMTINPKHKTMFARVAAIGAWPASVLAKRFNTGGGQGAHRRSVWPLNRAFQHSNDCRCRNHARRDRTQVRVAVGKRRIGFNRQRIGLDV